MALIAKLRLATVATAAFLFGLTGAQAQNFPAKPVKLIVPWAAGGPTDLVLRALADTTQKHLGQPVV